MRFFLKSEDITEIYCAGDLLEYPGYANEIIRILQQNKAKCVMGNNDVAYLEEMDCSDYTPEEDGSSKLLLKNDHRKS